MNDPVAMEECANPMMSSLWLNRMGCLYTVYKINGGTREQISIQHRKRTTGTYLASNKERRNTSHTYDIP